MIKQLLMTGFKMGLFFYMANRFYDKKTEKGGGLMARRRLDRLEENYDKNHPKKR